jgi:hypothetical protein
MGVDLGYPDREKNIDGAGLSSASAGNVRRQVRGANRRRGKIL